MLLGRVAVHVRQLRRRDPAVRFGLIVEPAARTASQTKPSAPVATNAPRHPKACRCRNGTTAGTTMAPMLAPELKTPVARARSLLGNHSATVLMQAGKVGRFAEAQKEHGEAEGEHRGGEARQHGGDAPERDGDGEAAARAQTVGEAAGADQADGVGRLEGRGHVAVLLFVEADDAFEGVFQVGQHAAIDVGDHGGEEEQGADDPANTRHRRPRGHNGVHESTTIIATGGAGEGKYALRNGDRIGCFSRDQYRQGTSHPLNTPGLRARS